MTITGNYFKDILVAISFSNTTPQIMKQVIELCATANVTIHLLHADSSNNNTGEEDAADTAKKLEQWSRCLQEVVPSGTVQQYLLSGTVQQCLLKLAKDLRPQLIIVGKPSKTGWMKWHKPLLDTDKLVRLSNCPVLTVVQHDRHSKVKTIMVPVRNFVPIRKLELLAVFAKTYKAKILLVAMQQNFFVRETERRVLLDTFSVLRNGLYHKVDYLLLKGNNFPRAIAKAAAENGADLLIANPQKETRISSFFNKGINDILPAHSGLKILSVAPYPDVPQEDGTDTST